MAGSPDGHRPKRDRRTTLMMFEAIKKEGFTGCYARVTEFVRNWRNLTTPSKSAYVTLRFKLGDAFQFDWSEEWLVIGGKIKAASLVAFSQVEVVYMEPVIHASQP